MTKNGNYDTKNGLLSRNYDKQSNVCRLTIKRRKKTFSFVVNWSRSQLFSNELKNSLSSSRNKEPIEKQHTPYLLST